jgi:Glyoxalase-like domain
MKITIDHVTFCGSSLDELQNAFRNVGLTTEYGGPHANGVTHMALLGFDDGSYLELIAPMERGEGASGVMSGWVGLMQADAGACAWAVHTSNIQAEVNRLKAAGIAVTAPEQGGRKKIDGTIIRWQTAALGPGHAGALLPFMIQDETLRDLRVRPSASIRDTGLTGIGMVVLGVKDLSTAVTSFRKAYSWDAPQMEESRQLAARLAHFPDTPVVLATPADGNSWLNARLDLFGDRPLAFLLAISDLSRVSKRFALIRADTWFGRKLAWFDEAQLHGARFGVIE